MDPPEMAFLPCAAPRRRVIAGRHGVDFNASAKYDIHALLHCGIKELNRSWQRQIE
jgi:hypothetical protein